MRGRAEQQQGGEWITNGVEVLMQARGAQIISRRSQRSHPVVPAGDAEQAASHESGLEFGSHFRAERRNTVNPRLGEAFNI